MKRFFFTSIALSSVVLATGALEISAKAQNPILAGNSSNSITSPIYIAQTDTSIATLEKAIFDSVNQHRTNRGKPRLTLDTRISEQARTHSKNMASGAVPFSHQGFAQRVQAIAKVIPLSAAAENVAYNQGYSSPATIAVQGWLNSSGHRANIEGNYNKTGIGVAKNARGAYYFTQIFIRSR